MNAIAVDTSVLLTIFKGEPKGELWLDCLQTAAETATLLLYRFTDGIKDAVRRFRFSNYGERL